MNARPPERDRIVGAYVLGILMVAILIGVAVDAFVRPAYWLAGMP